MPIDDDRVRGRPGDHDALRTEMLELLALLTAAESPSSDDDALDACASLLSALAEEVVGICPAQSRPRDGGPPVVRIDGGPPGAPDRVLLLGHLDTVWATGTLEARPFAVDDGKAVGPGVFDMKAGLVQGLLVLRRLGCRPHAGPPVSMLVTFDEEIGSPDCRPLIQEAAQVAQAVLVLEPAAAGGAAKIARKGWGRYELRIVGRAAHAGLDPDHGHNALLELVRLAGECSALDRRRPGLRVIPTTARAGDAPNTIPDHGILSLDVRADRADDLHWIDRELRRLVASTGFAGEVVLAGGPNRPPFEPAMSSALQTRWDRCRRALGIDLPPPVSVGGVSDGNLTAAFGVPTLDGLGAIGGGAHARDEWVDTRSLPDRVALTAALVESLLETPLPAPTADEPDHREG